MAEQNAIIKPHTVHINGRSSVTITGVTEIDSFDENTVAVYTSEGELIVRGNALHIGKIDVDSGDLALDGQIISLEYTDNSLMRGSLWSRLFR